MNDFISAVQNQNSESSRNINVKLSDNTYAYINSQGLAKKFNSMAEYEATKGVNGCPEEVINIDRTWANINYRVGAPMAVYTDNNIMRGQGCGNENRLVAPQIDPNDEFDQAYYERVAEKKFDSIEEATSDWQTSGRVAGLAPFKDAASLHKLGKMGYIDVDSIFHEIDPTFSNSYNGPTPSYVKGTEMRSCLAPDTVNFRDKIYLKYGDSYLYSPDKRNVKVTESVPSGDTGFFYIQVPIADVKSTGNIPPSLYNYGLDYGASCIISTTYDWNSPECGKWGCYTGKVFNDTFSLTNSEYATNLKFISTTGIANATNIKYGEQFYIMGEVYKNILQPGDELTKLISGNYELYFSEGKLLFKNTQTGVIATLKDSIDPSVVKVKWTGNLLGFYNSNNDEVTSYLKLDKSTDKGNLVVKTTGLIQIVDASGNILKKNDSSIPDSKDIPIYTYATIVDGEFSFTENIADRKRFSIGNPNYTNSCSISALQRNCNDTSNCIGFIHSADENTWQQIQTTDSSSDYKISETDTQVYLRNMTASLTGEYCPANQEPVFMNRTTLSAYPKGKSVASNSASCTQKPQLVVPAFNKYIKGINDKIKIPVESSVGIDKLRGLSEQIDPLLSKYESNYSSWIESKGKPTALQNTLQQRITDTYTMDEYYRSMAILWGVITLAMIAIVLFRYKN